MAHHNLEYLCTAKRLNACQAMLILFTSVIVAPVIWHLESDLQRGLQREPTPSSCPTAKIYAPTSHQDRIITWAHTSPASGYPGITRTGGSPWPLTCVNMASPVPSAPPLRVLIHPPRASSCHWKCRGAPGPTWWWTLSPTYRSLGTTLWFWWWLTGSYSSTFYITTTFRGLQFTSQVWWAFCKQMGTTVGLASANHPEANVQAERTNQDLWRFLGTYCYNR